MSEPAIEPVQGGAPIHPLLSIFEDQVARQPQHPAASDDTIMLDYHRFRAAAAHLATHIAAQSVAPRVGVLAPASVAGAAAVFACWYAGRVPVPLNFLLAPAELGRIIRDAGIDLVLTVARLAPAVAATGLKTLVLTPELIGQASGTDCKPVETDTGHKPVAQPQMPPLPPEVASVDLAVLLYTSGTSADPKGVCLSFGNLVQNVRAGVVAAELDGQHVFLGLLPLFHSTGFTATLLVPLLTGASIVFQSRFNPVAVVQAIAQRRVTVFVAVASMYGVLAEMKQVTPQQLATLSHPISGGEPLPPEVAAAWERRFGSRILEGYGMTEASPIVSLNTPRHHRPRSVGRPLPGITVTAVAAGGQPLPCGQDGELVVRGHCVMQGYWNRPDLTAAAIRDGALYTGDVGHVDGDGFVFITGRAKEMMIVGGENVFPAEIERVLVQHDAVLEAAVIGTRDSVRGEVPVAFVTLVEGQTTSDVELRQFCRQHLAPYKVPRQVFIGGDLPRGPTGKILKRALCMPA